uniref:Nitronate monooxygenase domain-containing protein n=1 Tax=Alexandrium andersonii TaxID=327968 RepID=A0A7S2FDC9_9DINO
MPLVPQCVDLCKGKKNFFGTEIPVVAAGGLFDGRHLAASLAMGATGVWVGTRFIATPEAATSEVHRKNVVKSNSVDTLQTIVYSGRPCRVIKNEYANKWEETPHKIKELTEQGIVPFERDLKDGKAPVYAWGNNIMGQAVGGIKEIMPAGDVVKMFVSQAVDVLQKSPAMLSKL